MQLRAFNRDNAPHLLNCAVTLAREHRDTFGSRCLAAWWRIELGQGCRFFGLPILRRAPGSILRVGEGCQFRSAQWANLVGINRPCMLATMLPDAVLEIGEGCGFSGTTIGCASRVTLGRRVMCGANVTISDTDWHPIDWRERAAGVTATTPIAPVSIDDDAWIGMGALVLKGVSIGARTIVGAGSIVSRPLPADVIAAGAPAKVIRKLARSDHPEEVALQYARGGAQA